MIHEEIEVLELYPNNQKNTKNNNVVWLTVNAAFVFMCLVVIIFGFKYRNAEVAKASVVEEVPAKLHEIINNTLEEDKLFSFKGDVENNYVVFNNLLWRILRVNSSGTITLILNESLNISPKSIGETFSLEDYLNNKLLNELDKSILTHNNMCSDTTADLTNITCDVIDNNYISLLDLNSFVESIENNKTFIVKDNEIIWLLNNYNDNKSWHTKGSKISHSDVSAIYNVKPVITLKNNIEYISGDGTKTNPYLINDTNKLSIGSTIKLGNDYYTVYETTDDLKIVLNKNLNNKYTYTGNYTELIKELNNNFYNSLEYKDLIKETSYETVNIKNNQINKNIFTSKVSLLNILDFKFSNTIKDYYLLSTVDNYILVNNTPIIYGFNNGSHYLRPCITLKDEVKEMLRFDNGVFVLGEL